MFTFLLYRIYKRLQIVGYLILLLTILLVSCNSDKPSKKLDLSRREPVETITKDQQPANFLRVAVGGMITPKEGFGYYRRFLDYVGAKLGMRMQIVDRENYAEINDLVKTGNVDLAFVCGGPYVQGHDEFGMELLAAPQAYGKRVYYSYIIVPKKSSIQKFSDLRGRTFAFTDPMSNSGALVPTYMLSRMHETPESFFKSVIFTQSHDKSIKAVVQGVVDGAAVDSLIWEYFNKTEPLFTAETKIIEKSPPYGIPPVVVRRDMKPELKNKLRRIFLTANQDPQGHEILKGMMIDKFVPIDDSAYDSIREMKKWTDKQQKLEKRSE